MAINNSMAAPGGYGSLWNATTITRFTTTTEEARNDYLGLVNFDRNYRQAHGYLATIICVFGIIFNICNIYILTRKNMKNSATNILLTGIAVFDLLTEVTYIPFTMHFHILTETSHEYGHDRMWVYYALISINTMLIAHTAAMWMTVALATFRCIFVTMHTKARTLCSVQRAYLTTVLVLFESIILCIPYFICYTVVEYPQKEEGVSHPWIGETIICEKQSKFLRTFTFLVFGGIIKFCACLILLIFTAILVVSLRQVKKRHESLMQKSQSQHKQREHNRTTAMLIVVVSTFALTELPQGILVLVCSVNKWYFDNVYVYLGDLFDIIVLFNSSVNFIMYASMSHRFRETFVLKIIRPVRRVICCWCRNDDETGGNNGEAAIPLQAAAVNDSAGASSGRSVLRKVSTTSAGASMTEMSTLHTTDEV